MGSLENIVCKYLTNKYCLSNFVICSYLLYFFFFLEKKRVLMYDEFPMARN